MTLRNCYALLKPGGKLILGEITQPAEYMSLIYGTLPGWWSSKDGRIGGPCLSADQWNSQLLEAKFSGLDIIVRDSPRLRNHIISMMVSTKSDPQRETYDEIIILTPPAPSKDVDKIIQTLSESFPDTKLETETLRSVITTNDRRPKCTGKFIISLLEIEEPLLFNLSEQDFYNVKQAIQYSSGILWVTCGNEALDPFLRPVSGLFRVVKSENPQLRLHELHLSRTPDPQPDDIAGHIVCTFDSILAGNPEDAETEIVETNGRLRIPRLVDEVYMNQEIHACSSKPVSKLQPLFQPGRPLALVASVPGMLESLHFVDDLSYAQPLSENEMEVEVQANSLNYKQVLYTILNV
jgi:hypothetical protein